jgi:hypothetical protein
MGRARAKAPGGVLMAGGQQAGGLVGRAASPFYGLAQLPSQVVDHSDGHRQRQVVGEARRQMRPQGVARVSLATKEQPRFGLISLQFVDGSRHHLGRLGL